MHAGVRDIEQKIHDDAATERAHMAARAAVAGITRGLTAPALGHVRRVLEELPADAHLLELGCGLGEHARTLAIEHPGWRVCGIDMSGARINAARELQAPNLEFMTMDANKLDFGDGEFDAVVGLAVIHHLDVRKAVMEAHRVLKPGGVAVFLEPLAHNPAINAYRRRTPEARFVDEHPLTMSDLTDIKRAFAHVHIRYYCLLALSAIALRGVGDRLAGAARVDVILRPWLATMRAFDRGAFLLFPPARRWAWKAVVAAHK